MRCKPWGPNKLWTKASLLLTCRSVAAEGTTILYQDTHFIFNALECLSISPIGIATAGVRWWFLMVGRMNLMKIRSIAIGAKAYDWSDGHPFRAPGARITIMQILHTFLGSSQIRSISINLSLDSFVVAGPKTKSDDIGSVLWYTCVLHTLFDDFGPNNINECLRALPNLTSLQIPYRTFSSAMQDWNIPQHHTVNVDFLEVLESEQRFLKVHSALLTDIGKPYCKAVAVAVTNLRYRTAAFYTPRGYEGLLTPSQTTKIDRNTDSI